MGRYCFAWNGRTYRIRARTIFDAMVEFHSLFEDKYQDIQELRITKES